MLQSIRVRVFDPEYYSLQVLNYHQMNVELRVKITVTTVWNTGETGDIYFLALLAIYKPCVFVPY